MTQTALAGVWESILTELRHYRDTRREVERLAGDHDAALVSSYLELIGARYVEARREFVGAIRSSAPARGQRALSLLLEVNKELDTARARLA